MSQCPHTTVYLASSYYCIFSVLILLYLCPHTSVCVLILRYVCPHTNIYVLILLHLCPLTTVCVSSYYYICVLRCKGVRNLSSYYYICVRILLHMCPHTTSVSSGAKASATSAAGLASRLPQGFSSYKITRCHGRTAFRRLVSVLRVGEREKERKREREREREEREREGESRAVPRQSWIQPTRQRLSTGGAKIKIKSAQEIFKIWRDKKTLVTRPSGKNTSTHAHTHTHEFGVCYKFYNLRLPLSLSLY